MPVSHPTRRKILFGVGLVVAVQALNGYWAVNGALEFVRITAVRRSPGRVRISVWDRGPGIPAEHRGHVFEPYFTTRRAGTGLGLPITRNIVESLGGTIAVGTASPGTVIDLDIPEVAPDPLAPSPRMPT